jgi:hypothetical protein
MLTFGTFESPVQIVEFTAFAFFDHYLVDDGLINTICDVVTGNLREV